MDTSNKRTKNLSLLNAFLRLSRPFTCVTSALSVLIAGAYAANSLPLRLIVSSISAAALAAAGNMYNDVIDLPVDSLNRPERVLPKGQISPTSALIASAMLALFSLLLAWFANYKVLLFAIFTAFLLWSYSNYLKNTVLIGNLLIGLLSGMLSVYGGLAVGNPLRPLLLGLVTFVGITGREVLKTIADFQGDSIMGLRTIATAWGTHMSLRICQLILIFFIFTTLIPFMAHQLGFKYFLLLLIGVLPIVVLSLVKLIGQPSVKTLRFVLLVQKFAFISWILAVVLDRFV